MHTTTDVALVRFTDAVSLFLYCWWTLYFITLTTPRYWTTVKTTTAFIKKPIADITLRYVLKVYVYRLLPIAVYQEFVEHVLLATNQLSAVLCYYYYYYYYYVAGITVKPFGMYRKSPKRNHPSTVRPYTLCSVGCASVRV